MASPSSLPASSSENPSSDLLKEIRSHEIAISELNSLATSRNVYQKNGGLFFRKSIQTAIQSEQKQLDTAKELLQKMDTDLK
ncbi:Prefoldin beta-like protein [Dioscorea alata]|uniref:Prefoldin beta-like protein n=1 Tax=Dioscorea alata TaxID=55571 RepID=A0ACB7WW96_DIOAL|nr:Prefoldin beta-like protein [Dioscorea alata]